MHAPPIHATRSSWRRKLLVGAGVAAAALVALAGPAGAQEIEAADVQTNLDNVFVLLAAVLVIFMQAGFALVEAGLTRAKSVANIMMKNLMDFCAGAIAFWAFGFAFAYNGDTDGIGKFIGSGDWFLGDGSFTYGTLDADGLLRVPGGVRRHRGHDRLGRHGRAHEVQGVPRLQLRHQPDHLPGRRALGVGRRLAAPAGHAVPRLRRLDHRAHDRRRRRVLGRQDPRPPHRQVRPRRQAAGHPRPQRAVRHPRAASSCSWAGTASTPAPSWRPTRAIGGIARHHHAGRRGRCPRRHGHGVDPHAASPTSP